MKRTATNERIDMYPGMIWRYETPNARAIKHVHVGDEDLVFVQPGETDHALYIGVFNKTGGNTDGKAGSTTVVVQNSNGGSDNTGGKAGDKAGTKVGGETNVIVLGAEDEVIDNVLIAAWPSYLREDEGLIRVLRNGHHYDIYQCDSHCRRVPNFVPEPPGSLPPGTAHPISTRPGLAVTSR
jgi:hypothetical protein